MTYFNDLLIGIRSRRCRTLLWFLVVCVMAMSAQTLGASTTETLTIAESSIANNNPTGPAITMPPALIADGWTWSQFFSPIKTILGSRARMLQFGAIGCCIALYIIWWRK
jgi:hypothetical protein